MLFELGERLYSKITEVVIPEWQEAFRNLTKDDCIDYIFNLTINRTYDGYLREKSVVNDVLKKRYPELRFEESDSDLDHAGDIDYIAWITDDEAIGFQIKPTTIKSNFANYSPSERMKRNFLDFEEKYGGKVFIIESLDGEVANTVIYDDIDKEIEKLKKNR